MLDKYIEQIKQEIINKTQTLIQIPSIYEKSDNPYEPFGKNINKALNYMLSLGKELGFRTKNIDGYCGYIEFGEGKDLIGIIGHLDVVPEGENWTYPAFGGTIFDNKIYGRGAIDDKGPVIASLYAMKAVMETCKIKKRVRLILGLNEENNWKCIEHYKQNEEYPTVGFSPDADFPCIYAEKGILTCYLLMDYSNSMNQDIIIKEFNSYNNAINVVPKICSTILQINPSKILMSDFIEKIKNLINKFNFEIDIYKINEQDIKLTSHGIQAHSAHPDLGINAISRLLILLDSILKTYSISIDLLDFFSKKIHTQYDGKNLGIDFKDESGSLTLNVSDLKLENKFIKIGMNLRIPVTIPIIDIGNAFLKQTSSYINVDFQTKEYKEPIYISKNNNLVKTLCKIYNETTHSQEDPIAIGGATYARAFENCISFGPNLPGQKDMCHQTDEFISIDNLILASKIYAKAIYELGTT